MTHRKPPASHPTATDPAQRLRAATAETIAALRPQLAILAGLSMLRPKPRTTGSEQPSPPEPPEPA